jgi:hypothetical protein
MKIGNILWDTDGDREARASLPKEVELPSRFDQSHFASREEWLDTISNWLSDEFGFCHLGFDVGDDGI